METRGDDKKISHASLMMGSFLSGIFADIQMIGIGEQVMELFRDGRYVEANQLAVGAIEQRIAGSKKGVNDIEARAAVRTGVLKQIAADSGLTSPPKHLALAQDNAQKTRAQIAYETYYRQAIQSRLAPLWDGLDSHRDFTTEKERWHEVVLALETEAIEKSR